MSIKIEKKIRYFSEIKDNYSQQWSFKENNWQFDYLIYPNLNSNKLLVLMPAALPRNKEIVLPYFHRHSWASKFGMNVIVVSDPTLAINKNLLGGWFLGNQDDYVLRRIIGHLRLVQEQLQIERKNMCFSGSSLGGFGALLSASMLKGTIAYAENPQLDLYGYKYQSHIENLSKYCFNNNISLMFKEHPERFSILEGFKKYNNIPHAYVVQKQSDKDHYNGQYKVFLKKLMELNISRKIFISEEIGDELDQSGHTPLTFEQMKKRIEHLFYLSNGY